MATPLAELDTAIKTMLTTYLCVETPPASGINLPLQAIHQVPFKSMADIEAVLQENIKWAPCGFLSWPNFSPDIIAARVANAHVGQWKSPVTYNFVAVTESMREHETRKIKLYEVMQELIENVTGRAITGLTAPWVAYNLFVDNFDTLDSDNFAAIGFTINSQLNYPAVARQ